MGLQQAEDDGDVLVRRRDTGRGGKVTKKSRKKETTAALIQRDQMGDNEGLRNLLRINRKSANNGSTKGQNNKEVQFPH